MSVVSVSETTHWIYLTGVLKWNLHQKYPSFFRHVLKSGNGFRIRPPLQRIHDFMMHLFFLPSFMFYVFQSFNPVNRNQRSKCLSSGLRLGQKHWSRVRVRFLRTGQDFLCFILSPLKISGACLPRT